MFMFISCHLDILKRICNEKAVSICHIYMTLLCYLRYSSREVKAKECWEASSLFYRPFQCPINNQHLYLLVTNVEFWWSSIRPKCVSLCSMHDCLSTLSIYSILCEIEVKNRFPKNFANPLGTFLCSDGLMELSVT